MLPYDITALRQLLQTHNMSLSKSLGQNFLTDASICRDIAADASSQGLPIVEIGPGAGALTVALCQAAPKVVSIEIDERLTPVLSDVVKFENFTLINQDFLKTDLEELAGVHFNGQKFSVAGNLPYYISSKIIKKLIDANHLFSHATVMVQKEFADRLSAAPASKDYRAITPIFQYYFELEYLFDVPTHVFLPPPEVTSSVIRFRPRKNRPLTPAQETMLCRIIQAGFAARRKQFCSVAPSLGFSKSDFMAALHAIGLPDAVRAEALSTQQFVSFYNNLIKT